MHNTCVSSSFTIRCKGSVSFSCNDYYNYCSNERVDRHPLSYSSSQCCSCCANSRYTSKGPVLNPSCYLYGLKQSTLIQWAPYKRLILNGLDRVYGSGFPVCDAGRSCYCETNERKVCGRRRLGDRRYWCVSFEGDCERESLCGGGGGVVDQAEIMLSLLTEDVGDECFSVGERRGKSVRKIDVEKGRNGGCNNVRSRKKNVDSGILGSSSKFEYEMKVTRAKEEDRRRKEDKRREEEREVLLKRDSRRARVKDEERREKRLLENSSGMMREEERENLLRGTQMERVREEERENLSGRQDHWQKVRKDGSSCSSYYSLSSAEFESDDEIQVKQEKFEGESSGGYGRVSERSEALESNGVRKEFDRHGDYSKEGRVILRNEKSQAGLYGASNSVESDWRKKSEKKLTDVSVEATEYRKELANKQSRYREDQESSYGKAFDAYSKSDDRNKKSTLSVNFDERTREQQKQTTETGIKMNYKQFTEKSEAYGTDFKTSSASHKLYSAKDENSSKSATSVREATEHHLTAGQVIREEEHRGSYRKTAEASKVQETDIGGASTAVRQSESRLKNQEDYSAARTKSSAYNTEEQYHQAGQSSRLVDSRVKHQQLTSDVNSERTYVSQMESESRLKKQEASSSFVHNSHLESREHLLESNTKHCRIQGSRQVSEEMTDTSISSDIGISAVDDGNKRKFEVGMVSIVDDGNKRKSEVGMAHSSSQSAARGPLHVKPTSGLVIKEISDERLHTGSTALPQNTEDKSQTLCAAKENEVHGQPMELISHEDALGSAERLQKSSAQYVGEFVQMVKNEISSSEIHKSKETYKTKLVSENEQHNQASLSSYGSGVSQSKEHDLWRSSQVSGAKGPSDEMWDVVTVPSSQEPTMAEALEEEGATDNAIVKRTGRSLWNVIADIVRFRWDLRHKSHSSSPRSGRRSSSHRSTSSETWFSGHELEESNDSNAQKDRTSLTQGSISVDQREEGISSQREISHPSSSKGEKKHKEAGVLNSSVLQKDSSSKANIALPSRQATQQTDNKDRPAETEGAELSTPLRALKLGRSPAVEQILATGEAEGSGSGSVVQIDPVPIVLSNKSSPEGKIEELERRKFQRNDQVLKDRFDEWEEAYRSETEQRKIDEMFMREALLEAKKAADNWEVPVGAVLVQGGKIIARGYNLVEELRDSTAHAEMICIREASNILRTWRLSETALYVTLEPCPMCAGAILQARIDTVVWGAPNKLLGADGSWIRLFPSDEEGSGLESSSDKPPAPVHPFHPKIVIRRGVLESECADTMQQFFQLRRKKKENKEEHTTPPSCLPIAHHPSKFMTKMHDVFHIMFCL